MQEVITGCSQFSDICTLNYDVCCFGPGVAHLPLPGAAAEATLLITGAAAAEGAPTTTALHQQQRARGQPTLSETWLLLTLSVMISTAVTNIIISAARAPAQAVSTRGEGVTAAEVTVQRDRMVQ